MQSIEYLLKQINQDTRYFKLITRNNQIQLICITLRPIYCLNLYLARKAKGVPKDSLLMTNITRLTVLGKMYAFTTGTGLKLPENSQNKFISLFRSLSLYSLELLLNDYTNVFCIEASYQKFSKYLKDTNINCKLLGTSINRKTDNKLDNYQLSLGNNITQFDTENASRILRSLDRAFIKLFKEPVIIYTYDTNYNSIPTIYKSIKEYINDNKY